MLYISQQNFHLIIIFNTNWKTHINNLKKKSTSPVVFFINIGCFYINKALTKSKEYANIPIKKKHIYRHCIVQINKRHHCSEHFWNRAKFCVCQVLCEF